MITRTSISVGAAYETFRFALPGLSDPPKWHAILAVYIYRERATYFLYFTNAAA